MGFRGRAGAILKNRHVLLTRTGIAISRHCGLLLTRMDIASPRHPSFLSVVTERKQRARLRGKPHGFPLRTPFLHLNCFPFLSLELFRCDMGRNRVCSSSTPSEPFDIIDLRATARTVGEAALKSESITAFVGAILGRRNFSAVIWDAIASVLFEYPLNPSI